MRAHWPTYFVATWEGDRLKCTARKNHEKNVLRHLLYKRMPRSARRVMPGFPHQVTQRGTDRQIVFHSQRDRRVYLDLLKEYNDQAGGQHSGLLLDEQPHPPDSDA